MSAGIVLILMPNINIQEVFNLNILFHQINYFFILIYLTVLIAFGVFRPLIPLRFANNDSEMNFNAIYLILGINILIKIMNELNSNYGINLILYVAINSFILIFYIINDKLSLEKIKIKLELNEKEKRIEELSLYIDIIEQITEKYKEFKHDYKNMLLGVGIENLMKTIY